jgi:hypothetical protein
MHSLLASLAAPLLVFGTGPEGVKGPDSVKLVKNGTVQEGRVVFEGKDEIILRTDKKDLHIARADIAEIRSLERSLATILDRDLQTTDPVALSTIAKDCEQAGLTAEAHNFWLRVLLADPKNQAAVKAVGAQVVKDEVKVGFGKEKRPLADLAKRQASWKDAFEIQSTHFLLRSDLDLPLALDASLAFERNYRRFYDLLGEPLEMFVFDEDPEVCIYGRAADFPVAPVKGDSVWFAPGINRLNVLTETNPEVRDIIHELIRMLLFNALRRSAGDTTQVPQWTSTGIAELFAIAAPAERFGPWSEIGKPDADVFGLARSAHVDLARVFDASVNDFNADRKRGELRAAAYSLVHYLVFGKDRALRAGYGKFLREGAKGKISLGALSEALGLSTDEIESGWHAYVQANAR